MLKDLLDHDRIFHARDHFHRTAAVVAGLDIDLEYSLQTLRLTLIATWRAGMDSSAGAAPRRPRLARVTCSRSRWFGAPSHQHGPVVTREVDAWRRHQGGQPGYVVLRLIVLKWTGTGKDLVSEFEISDPLNLQRQHLFANNLKIDAKRCTSIGLRKRV